MSNGTMIGELNGYANGKSMNGNKPSNGLTNGYSKKIDPDDDKNQNGKKKCSSEVKLVEEYEETPFIIIILCYISYVILNFFGHLRDFLRNTGIEKNKCAVERNRPGYVPLYSNYESFYTRNIYRRICHGWNQPICSSPGTVIDIVDRETDDYNWTFRFPGTTSRCINMGSYNYLGFAENIGPRAELVKESILKYGTSVGSPRHEYVNFINCRPTFQGPFVAQPVPVGPINPVGPHPSSGSGFGGGGGGSFNAGPYRVAFGQGMGGGFGFNPHGAGSGFGAGSGYSINGPGINVQQGQGFGAGSGQSFG